MKGIEITDEITISSHTTPKEVAQMITETWMSLDQMERMILVYGKFQAKRVKDQAIDIAIDTESPKDALIMINRIKL